MEVDKHGVLHQCIGYYFDGSQYIYVDENPGKGYSSIRVFIGTVPNELKQVKIVDVNRMRDGGSLEIRFIPQQVLWLPCKVRLNQGDQPKRNGNILINQGQPPLDTKLTLYVPRPFPVRQCDVGHPLILDNGQRRCCDVCGENCGTNYYTCKECDFDVCLGC